MKLVIVTGMSGAGKTTALKILEDVGFYCVDNLPIRLIEKFAELVLSGADGRREVALGIDVRSWEELPLLKNILEGWRKQELPFSILFLDSSDEVLIKRYKETRRSHPLARSGRVEKGIALEAAVPFPEQSVRWKQKTQAEYFRLLALCDRVSVVSEYFSVAAYRERDRYMVDASSLVIGVESIPDGGTARTLSYAKAQGRRIVLLGKDEVRSPTARRRRRRTSAAEVGDPFRGVD